MSESGCLRDAKLQNLELEGRLEVTKGIVGGLVVHNFRKFLMKTADLISIKKNNDAVASGTDTDINNIIFSNGLRLFSQNIGAQTLYYPQTNSNGFDISGDQTNNKGLQYVVKCNEVNTATLPTSYKSNSFHLDSFVVGTSAAFFMRAVIEITQVSGTDDCLIGFRKVENFKAAVDDYAEMAAFNIISGSIKTETITGSAATTQTNLTAPESGDFDNTQVWTFEVLVSQGGVVTYRMGTPSVGKSVVAPSPVVAFTIADGTEVTPFIYILQTADDTPVILHSLEYGLQ